MITLSVIFLKAINTPSSIHIHCSVILAIFSPFSESFISERWLLEDQREALEPKIFNSNATSIHSTAAFIPFSVGSANCVGITSMASRFDLAFAPGYTNPLL